jgi:EAL domain-containing protein (putative c-di-GMP-specific phosphodiesterase class I)
LDRILNYELFKCIKIDGGLISQVLTNKPSKLIVENLISMSKDLGLNVIAEFVETPEQRDWLIQAGCDMGQGKLFGLAQPLR